SADQPSATAPQGPSNGAGQEAPSITGDGTPATVIDDREVEGILGKNVRSTAGEDMGKIIDVIVKRDGQVRAAVIDFGGFLGVGSRKIAVDWGALSFPPSGAVDHVVLNLTRDQVRLAPEYRPGEPVVVLGSANPEQIKPENPSQPENTAPEKQCCPPLGRCASMVDGGGLISNPKKKSALKARNGMLFLPPAAKPRGLRAGACMVSTGSSFSSPMRRWVS